MINVGTVREWWEISGRYPHLREEGLGYNFLKVIGYCFILDQIEGLPGVQRILEFGHGFNPTIFAELGAKYEVHGIDDYQALPYFPAKDGWEASYSDYIAQFPQGHFHRGLLGKGLNDLPAGYFDIVCSVSVLEEIAPEVLPEVIKDAHRVLKPGGWFINSFDFRPDLTVVLNEYLKLQVRAGFDLEVPEQPPISLYRKDLAMEDQRLVMLNYQGATQSRFGGNWHTFLTASRAVPDNRPSGAIPTVTLPPPNGCLIHLWDRWRATTVFYGKKWLGPTLTAYVKRILGR